MSRKVISLLLCVFLIFALAAPSFAHPGRTDGKGGHTNHSTGEYHYHHGYPEHQHTGGICPYDFDDKTGKNSGTSSSKKNDSSIEKPAAKEEPKKELSIISKLMPFVEMVFWIAVDIGAFILGLSIIYYIFEAIKGLFKRK